MSALLAQFHYLSEDVALLWIENHYLLHLAVFPSFFLLRASSPCRGASTPVVGRHFSGISALQRVASLHSVIASTSVPQSRLWVPFYFVLFRSCSFLRVA